MSRNHGSLPCATAFLVLTVAATAGAADTNERVRALLGGDLSAQTARDEAVKELATGGEAAARALVPYLGHDALYVAMVANDAYEKMGPVAAPVLREVVSSDAEVNTRRLALYLLARLGLAEDAPLFIEHLDDADWRFRALAARGIGEASAADTARTGQALVPLVQDPDRSVRRWAMIALGHIGDATMAVPLADALEDEVFRVREAAVGALVALCARGASETVRTAVWPMQTGDWPPPARAAALRVLATAGRPEDADAIARHLDDPAPVVRAAAIEALAALAPQTARRQVPESDGNLYVDFVRRKVLR